MGKSAFTDEDNELLNELGIEVDLEKAQKHTPAEERIIDGFEEISRFYEDYGRLPTMNESADVFERKYALRLDRINSLEDSRELLRSYDKHGILDMVPPATLHEPDAMTDQEILDELGVDAQDAHALTNLQHVKPRAEIDPAEDVASRTRCPDFDQFKPLFLKVKHDLDIGTRNTHTYKDDATILKGDFYILGGQIAYIADMGAEFTTKFGRKDSRIRVIYDNGTETAGMLMRSFQRALNKDGNARRVDPMNAVSLFSDTLDETDNQSGTIYVLRSLSNHPVIVENRNVVHKIGVTGGEVTKRISSAKNDPTFLMADVEIVATYKLANINRVKLEALIHKFFSEAQLSIEVQDRFGKTVTVKEWFLAPLFVIDQMIEKLKSGNLSAYYYDKQSATIKKY